MRALVQRVSEARVEAQGRVTGAIGRGLLVLLGVARGDTRTEAGYLVDKIAGLRIFPGEDGRMQRNVIQSGGSLLIVSQHTLMGDVTRGLRPSFDLAAPPEDAKILFDYFVARACATGIPVETGIFQSHMEVYLVNSGPVTLLCERRPGVTHD